MIAIAAFVVAQYPGFRAWYIPFSSMLLYPHDAELLKKQGSDITSLLYQSKRDVIAILKKATKPATFDKGDLRLIVQDRRDRWEVDHWGVVQYRGKARELSREDFYQLRLAIFIKVPGSEPKWEIAQP